MIASVKVFSFSAKLLVGCGLLVLGVGAVKAADLEAKPFAEAHVLLQVSDQDAGKYASVLDISNNLIKHYEGPDLVDIEVIAFGKAVEMYFTSKEAINPNASRIASLQENGIRFYVCLNTLETLSRVSGKTAELLPGVIGVQTGVAFIIEEIDEGYILIRP
jgi:intracellular sulfur oxidation DsrE/DsrF family protein